MIGENGKLTGYWARCEDVVWNTSDGKCPMMGNLGPHEHRIKPNGEVGIVVRFLEEDKA